MPASHHRRRFGRPASLLLSVAVALLGALPAAPAGAPAGGVAAGAPTGVDGGQARREQWQLGALRARTAWRYATGAGVTVAVVDSGVDAGHPDLAGRVLPGLDLVNDAHDGRYDAVGHGTTVAGLIAGRADDEAGVVGLAPGVTILPVRVLDADNRYDDAGVVAQGVRWAVDRGARVVNISLGGGGGSEALAAAVRYAADHDVVVVACTGNLGPGTPTDVWFPARYPGVVAVAGLNRDRSAWRSAVTGPATALSAPATSLVGARPGGYWTVQGTSFAAPLVAATAALIRSRWPQLPARQVVARLLGTADDLGPAGRDATYGFGAVDPVAALTRWVAPAAANPLDAGGAAVASRGAATARLAGSPALAAGDSPPTDPRLPVLTLVVVALVTAALRAVARRSAAPLTADH